MTKVRAGINIFGTGGPAVVRRSNGDLSCSDGGAMRPVPTFCSSQSLFPQEFIASSALLDELTASLLDSR